MWLLLVPSVHPGSCFNQRFGGEDMSQGVEVTKPRFFGGCNNRLNDSSNPVVGDDVLECSQSISVSVSCPTAVVGSVAFLHGFPQEFDKDEAIYVSARARCGLAANVHQQHGAFHHIIEQEELFVRRGCNARRQQVFGAIRAPSVRVRHCGPAAQSWQSIRTPGLVVAQHVAVE